MNSNLRHGAIVLATLGLTACAGGNGSDPLVSYNATAVYSNLADNVIVPTYQALATQADALVLAVNALDGSDLGDGELTAAQNAWKATRAPWEQSEGFLIGPVDSLGIDPRLDTWPLNTTDLVAAISAGFNPSASEDVQGFHTMEYLLFGDGVSGNTRTTEMSANELAYLQDLAADFATYTQTLVNTWTIHYNPSDSNSGPYSAELKLQGDGLYVSQLAVMEELVNGMIGIVTEVGNGKIGDPYGADIGSADTSKVESQYSWNSLTDFHNNIQSVLNVYTGKKGYNPATDTISTNMNGIYAYIAAHDPQLANRMLDEILDAMAKIALIDGDADSTTTDITNPSTQMPFRNAIKDSAGRTRIATAVSALAEVQGTLETEVLPLLTSTEFTN